MDPFEEFLTHNKELKTLLVTPGGNHGDSLIHMGHVKKLDEHGFEYSSFNLEEKYRWNPILAGKYLVNIGLWMTGSCAGFKLVDVTPDIELILFEGGGYINDIWYGLTLLNQVLKRNPQKVAIGPHSIRFRSSSIESYHTDRQVHIFCREEASLTYLNQMDLSETFIVNQSPEVALYLTREDLEKYIGKKEGVYQLVSFRNDKESAVSQELKNEVTDQCSNPIVSDVSMKGTLVDFVTIIEHAEKIFTDRLHVAILASILGKEATLFGNSYHKNKGVWDYSLRDTVSFIEV